VARTAAVGGRLSERAPALPVQSGESRSCDRGATETLRVGLTGDRVGVEGAVGRKNDKLGRADGQGLSAFSGVRARQRSFGWVGFRRVINNFGKKHDRRRTELRLSTRSTNTSDVAFFDRRASPATDLQPRPDFFDFFPDLGASSSRRARGQKDAPIVGTDDGVNTKA